MAGHTPETKAVVLDQLRNGDSYRDIEAATGVPRATIGRWADAEGIESPRIEQTQAAAAAAGEKNKLTWIHRRGELVDKLGVVAAELLEKARIAPARDAQALMTAVAIGVDKAQLLSGGATSRHEQLGLDRQRERILAKGDELAERRAAKDGTTGG